MSAGAGSDFAHPSPELEQLCINTIRTLSMDAVQKANSGHPGTPMALAPAAFVMWSRFLRHNPANASWVNRDRFVLSCGHASMLLYSMLYLTGYGLELEDLKQFRQWGSLTPGHPEWGHTRGVETTTGPLGQGISNAVGMAIAEALLSSQFGSEVIDHRVMGFCSDGDLMEGISHEAAGLAGHLGLGKMVFIYDDNHITIDGPTELSYTDDVLKRFDGYRWHTQRVEDGNDMDAIAAALQAAEDEVERPSLISMRTHIGYGAPTKQDTAAAHGSALGVEEIAAWKVKFGWPAEDFFVPPEALNYMRGQAAARGEALENEWNMRYESWAAADREKAAELERRLAGRLPDGWAAKLPVIEGEKLATRKATVKALATIAEVLPEVVGGSADLTESNGTELTGTEAFATGRPGRYIHYGIREHGMAGALNGMTVHGGVRPYGGTFLIFSDYHKNSVRLAALMGIPTIFEYSHDSIALGEDGPTHQPIEQLAGLRAIPRLHVFRPADANETVQAWRVALERTDGPSAIVVTRQDLPIYDRDVCAPASELEKGAYVMREAGPEKPQPDVILIGTGSEVWQCNDAADLLAADGVRARVVSMPCTELFEEQSQEYRDSVLPPAVFARVTVEAASTFGWDRYVGDNGKMIGIDRFGASAPGATVLKELGFTAENVALVARSLL